MSNRIVSQNPISKLTNSLVNKKSFANSNYQLRRGVIDGNCPPSTVRHRQIYLPPVSPEIRLILKGVWSIASICPSISDVRMRLQPKTLSWHLTLCPNMTEKVLNSKVKVHSWTNLLMKLPQLCVYNS